MNASRYIVTGAAVVALGLVAAPTAAAGQWSYVSYLDDNGVSYSSVLGVIELGKEVCHELRSGTSVQTIGRYLTGPLGYTGPEAGSIVVGAVEEMCPDTASFVAQQLDSTATETSDQIA